MSIKRYIFTQDFGFISKNTLLVEHKGNYYLKPPANDPLGATVPWLGTVTLRRKYVNSLVGTVLSLLTDLFVTAFEELPSEDNATISKLIDRTQNRSHSDALDVWKDTVNTFNEMFPRQITLGASIYANDMKSVFTVTQNAEPETKEDVFGVREPGVFVAKTPEEFEELKQRYMAPCEDTSPELGRAVSRDNPPTVNEYLKGWGGDRYPLDNFLKD